MPYNREDNSTIEVVDLTATGTVTHAPTSETYLLQPDEGYVYEVIELGVLVLAPPAAGAGTHDLTGSFTNARNTMFAVVALFGSGIQIFREGFVGNSGEAPSTLPEQILIMRKSIFATHDQPYEFVYTNSTDVDQTNDRIIKLVVKKYREAIL